MLLWFETTFSVLYPCASQGERFVTRSVPKCYYCWETLLHLGVNTLTDVNLAGCVLCSASATPFSVDSLL